MRKSFLLLLSLILTGKCFSQTPASQIFHLDSIPSQSGVILDKGWKFHAGDDPKWAKVGYDDATWQPVDPTLGLHNLPIVKKAGIGWFRLKMKVDSSLLNERLAMELTTQGASEIYLDGALIYRFGTVSLDFKEEQTQFITYRPFSLKLGDQPLQELAVRYSFHHKNLYLHIRRASCMTLILKENNQAFADYLGHEGLYQNLRSIQLSFYLPLGFLLLFLYYSYRLQKEYFYIGIFSFCMFLGMAMRILGETGTKTVNQVSFYVLTNQLLWVPGLVLLIHGTYILFKKHKSWAYYFIILYAILIFPFYFLFYDWGHVFGNSFVAIVILEFLRVNMQAFHDRKPGAIILMITSIICLLLMIGSIALEFMGRQELKLMGRMSRLELSFFLLSLNFIMPALGLSLFFAGEFARTGLALQSRLVEVEQLSEKTIAQEKEKQQILASQNITLETQVKERTTELIQERQALEIEKEAKLLAEFNRKFSESELKALRSQINPHFVFNILNTIESYALENNKEGVSAMIQKFSRLTRLVLENSMNQLVPFQNDWRSLQLYIELEQMRYADDFLVVYNIQDEILEGEYFIPPMIIQPFVENAIIHGLRNRADHYGILNLSARLQNEYIIVEVQDNGIGRTKAAALKGNNSIQKKSLGIKLTQDRISIFNNLKQNKKVNVGIEDLPEGTKVTIAMPAN
jgi:sensor histidine kinase YesM